MAFSIVILSKDNVNLLKCVRAIREMGEKADILVVNDGLMDPVPFDCRYIQGEKPFVFARNTNIGVRYTAPDDVILLNDDALIKTPGGFTKLEQVLKSHPEYGVIAAAADNVGNPNQSPRLFRPYGNGLRDEPRMVCFICVYIPRGTIDRVGLLDERYVGYGMDDDDYCLSVRKAGLKLGIYDGCFVNHSTLHSSYRFGKTADFSGNLKLFIEKWGMDNFGNPA